MESARNVFIVIDLAFGDCGKGTVVDFLTRRHGAGTVVRFNGGPQAGHNVVTADGRHHTFSQFGSGMFLPGVRTFLSRFMLIEPYALLNEAKHLAEIGVGDALERLLIDRRAPVITPVHQAANRLREIARGAGAHGTCGMGVGEAMQDLLDRPELMIRAGDLGDTERIARKLSEIVDYKVERLKDVIEAARPHMAAKTNLATLLQPSWIEAAAETYARVAQRARLVDTAGARELLREEGTMIYEGAQGVLLDEWFGFHPHTTWSTTTFENALTLLDECGYEGPQTKVGVLRTYFTRHGAGPFVSEEPSLAAGLPEPHNGDAGWQGGFRVGVFDAVAARYGLAVAGGADWLALTHLDRVERLPGYVCDAYEVERIDETLFVRDGKRVKDVRVQRPADLAHQERLTGALRRCRPVYTQVPQPGAEGFLQAMERELRTPVKLLSWGATAEHKRLL